MKALKLMAVLAFFCLPAASVNAQTDTSVATSRALLFADSLLHCYRYNNIDEYIAISHPGAVRYYGGKKAFREYVQRTRAVRPPSAESPEKTEVMQMMNDISEWQCVIRKTSQETVDGRKAAVISYMVGQSRDEGQTWKYFDVSLNSVENVIYIMPDIFDRLAIPHRQVIFEKGQMARNGK